MKNNIIATLCLLTVLPCACQQENGKVLRTGAEQTERYFPLLENHRVAVVSNQSSLVGTVHLVDTLLRSGIELVRILAPEHGFRGSAGAGVEVADETDPVSGLPVVSLYGDHRKPLPSDLENTDLVLFDLQDVGLRCYTYLSTMHLVMEACKEQGIPLIVLDRPNPLGRITDGPVLEPAFRSFVGMHPIPFAHGMTLGELAGMINGEGWLEGGGQCALTVIPCTAYTHDTGYTLPVRPSPNLPNSQAIQLYPSLVFFEGTVVSVGRGTDMPFQVFGHPELPGDFTFTPQSGQVNRNPPLAGELCRGSDLRTYQSTDNRQQIRLSWLLGAWKDFPDKEAFFNGYFDTLAGTGALRKAIEEGWTEDMIRESWREGLEHFRTQREKYLLYP